MFRAYIHDLATKMGIPLSTLSIVDGGSVGCLNVTLVKASTNGHTSMILVNKSEIDSLITGDCTNILEEKVRACLLHLQKLLETAVDQS